MPIGYLASHYPAVSHVFTLREVTALRRLGVDVETLSIHAAPPDQLLAAADREAARTTFAVLPISPLRLVGIHLRAFVTGPWRYLATLVRAWRLSAPGLRAHLWQLFYFAEAMVVYDHCRSAGIRHLHAQFADVATDVALLVSHRGGEGWSWSLALHGPVEFSDVTLNRISAKVKDARFVQAISHFGRSQVLAQVEEEQWDKVHVVRCGIDPTVYTPARPPRPAAELRVLCVGRLFQHKGQTILMEAVADLRRRGVPVRAIFIGDGPRRAALARLAVERGVAEHVDFLGAVGQDEIGSHYASADVVCVTSFAEGLPVVLMEAMALERPVVATAIMGVPELVEDGVSGLLVPPGSVTHLAEALASLAADPERRAEMGRAGRRKVLADYDVRRSAEQLQALFASL
jgi:glycosyltransferase involved in cell wall biosynthesis